MFFHSRATCAASVLHRLVPPGGRAAAHTATQIGNSTNSRQIWHHSLHATSVLLQM